MTGETRKPLSVPSSAKHFHFFFPFASRASRDTLVTDHSIGSNGSMYDKKVKGAQIVFHSVRLDVMSYLFFIRLINATFIT